MPTTAAPDPAPEPELQYDDSSVRWYVCKVLGAAAQGTTRSSDDSSKGGSGLSPEGAGVAGFRRLPGYLHDPALARAYSVDSRPGLVVVSGVSLQCCAALRLLCGSHCVPVFASARSALRSHNTSSPVDEPPSPFRTQAGGKDGVVAVWGSRELEAGRLPADEAVPALLSHKLHKGWCV